MNLIILFIDTSFQEFIDCPEMLSLKERIIWIHVDLPGQEANAPDLNTTLDFLLITF